MNPPVRRFSSLIRKALVNLASSDLRLLSTKSTADRSAKNGDDEWNDAWESAWLPEDLSGKNRAPWEADVNFSLSSDNPPPPSTATQLVLPSDVDAETKAFVEDMTDNWEQRRKSSQSPPNQQQQEEAKKEGNSLYSLENIKRDYRLKKQRIHAGLWVKEIEKQEEAKLVDSIDGVGGDDIERLLDSCSEYDLPLCMQTCIYT